MYQTCMYSHISFWILQFASVQFIPIYSQFIHWRRLLHYTWGYLVTYFTLHYYRKTFKKQKLFLREYNLSYHSIVILNNILVDGGNYDAILNHDQVPSKEEVQCQNDLQYNQLINIDKMVDGILLFVSSAMSSYLQNEIFVISNQQLQEACTVLQWNNVRNRWLKPSIEEYFKLKSLNFLTRNPPLI